MTKIPLFPAYRQAGTGPRDGTRGVSVIGTLDNLDYVKNSFHKSLPTSLSEREELPPPLKKGD